MKLARTLLVAALLVATASAVQAADVTHPAPDAAQAVQAPQTDAGGDALATPAGGCSDVDRWLADLGQDPLTLPATCGACSDPQCVGASRGRFCWKSGGQGPGNCNIYSGGYLCSTGGWECQCGSGPLP